MPHNGRVLHGARVAAWIPAAVSATWCTGAGLPTTNAGLLGLSVAAAGVTTSAHHSGARPDHRPPPPPRQVLGLLLVKPGIFPSNGRKVMWFFS